MEIKLIGYWHMPEWLVMLLNRCMGPAQAPKEKRDNLPVSDAVFSGNHYPRNR